jgi:heme exporter protein D
MHWINLDTFLNMGGYGFYVWGSFGVAALSCLIELVLLKNRKQKITMEKL